ncbi:MAG: ATP synthase [Chthonomonadaceae bacterium]|uniref:EscN/YscN/HrcN family type III secretion system ATPase n=1 Tax=Candidatus Nitrosymbiomonas proteolyticus TaxID=2608984 RepID=A0A809R9H9_9BACT|nr:EscN/YscN/HrcN family type III secretion system ATPase [Candidatus Nitrosymbiomonas proteolyticus]
MTSPSFEIALERIHQAPNLSVSGRVTQVVGLVIESNGPNARIGDSCWIETGSEVVQAEVVGFRGDRVLMMPLGDLAGARAGSIAHATGHCVSVPVGPSLMGRVLDGLGQPADGGPALETNRRIPVHNSAPNPMSRAMIQRPVATGVRAIDAMLTIGEGQRVGIFAGSGVGKSTLLGMIARGTSADVNVIALIGERGRELREFIENDLGPEGLARSVLVCATSDECAMVRVKAAYTATAIAEYFRDQGLSVMLMMDSVTRFAMAQREIGLAIGEPPSTKGYTPSVFAALPKLMERAGTNSKGAITGLYTVLVEGDDASEPISDAARSILDGHIMLSRSLAAKGHYPPIDLPHSLSRVMPMVAGDDHVETARKLRELIAAYGEVEDLVAIGAYKEGAKPLADRALKRWDKINGFLRQNRNEMTPLDAAIEGLKGVVHEEV